MIISLLSVVIIPLGVKALTSSFTIVFKTNKIQKAYTELIPGKDFNIVLHRLASGYDFLEIECVTNDNSYGYCYVYDPTSTVFDYDENIESDRHSDVKCRIYYVSVVERVVPEAKILPYF